MKHFDAKKEKGSAVLAVVLSLLAGMTIVVFFTNKGLIFEQKTSANQARSTKAMEAAEAGLEWALANLNYPTKINTSCTAIASPVSTDKIFRDRYTDSGLAPACVHTGTALSCSCPTSGNATPTGSGPAFKVSVAHVTGQTMMVEVTSTGCSSLAYPCTASGASADSTATVRQIFKIQSALATPPAAALTAKGNIDVQGSVAVTNTDEATNGITANAGGTVSISSTVHTIPGTPAASSLVGSDSSLSTLTDDQMFQTFFGQSKDAFKSSPMTYQMTCSNPCNSQLTAAISGGASVIWVNGDMNVNSNITLGSASNPVILVVDGNAHINGTATIYGVVYSTAQTWDDNGSGNSNIYGASIAEGSFQATGNADFAYDPDTLANLKLIAGQYGKVPGSWRDY